MTTRERINDAAEILLNYFEQKKTFQANKVMAVPAESYTDAIQWRNEIDLIFKRLPLMLALTCEMPKPGDYKAMEVVGMPVLIVRDKVGVVHAFLNVCAHRWAPVAAEGLGSCPHFRFICPFHGWAYSAEGKLIGVADHAKFGDLNKSLHGLKELPCSERYGMIFVCVTPGIPVDLDVYYSGLLEEFADFDLKNWTHLRSSVFEGPNWKLMWSNFFESYHTETLHSDTVALQFVPNLTHYEAFGPHMRLGFAQRSIGKLRERPRAEWERQEGEAFTFMRFLFPLTIGSLSASGMTTFTQTFPGPTPDKSRIVLHYLRKEPPADDVDREKINRDLDLAVEFAKRAFQDQDFAVVRESQKGLQSRAHEGLLYGRNERGPQYFHEWVNWYLSPDSTSPRPTL